jgi:hypothetical protein
MFATLFITELLCFRMPSRLERRKLPRDCSFYIVGVCWIFGRLKLKSVESWESLSTQPLQKLCDFSIDGRQFTRVRQEVARVTSKFQFLTETGFKPSYIPCMKYACNWEVVSDCPPSCFFSETATRSPLKCLICSK